MRRVTVTAGRGKDGRPENFDSIDFELGELWTVVGDTGSGKSRFIKDIEQLVHGDSVTGRSVLIDGERVSGARRRELSNHLVAHLGQNMRFILDASVESFLALHAESRGKEIDTREVIDAANSMTPEPISASQNLNLLSGGQARALMIADIALVCASPIVLIDEIENAGVDKERAFGRLRDADKLVLAVTHDPHTALMAPRRIVMSQGAVSAVVERTAEEEEIFERLSLEYRRHCRYQSLLRKGEHLK